MAINWKTEYKELKNLLVIENYTLAKAAEKYGVTKQRILQVIERYLPELDRTMYGASKSLKDRQEGRLQAIRARFNRDSYQDLSDLQKAHSRAFTRKKQNAKATGWEWTVGMVDMDWPSHCPIFGMELDWFAESRQENSPSFDRIDSNKGYVQGNVQVISWRANRIKNDGTADEHRKIAEYLDSL